MLGFEELSAPFFKMPKCLFDRTGKYFDMSVSAKLLYGLMLDRMSLSKANGWYDKDNRLYIIYSIDTVKETVGCGKNKAIKLLKELSDYGLIERIPRRCNLPDLIYVNEPNLPEVKKEPEQKQDSISIECVCVEERETLRDCSPNQTAEVSKASDGGLKSKPPEVSKTNSNKTNSNKTEINNTLDIEIDRDMNDVSACVNRLKNRIKEQISYNDLVRNFPFDRPIIDEMVEGIMDIYMTRDAKAYMTVSGQKYPVYYVKYRYSLLDCDRMEYILECLKKTGTKVNSIKRYMTAVLFNATSSCDLYYDRAVKADMRSDAARKWASEYQPRQYSNAQLNAQLYRVAV